MFGTLTTGLKNGLRRLRDNPQLLYTIVIAVVIFLAFVFMAMRFISIAQDAQDRLINVRIGSIQDAFAAFAPNELSDPAGLNAKIKAITDANQTIEEFDVLSLSSNKQTPAVLASFHRAVGSQYTVNADDQKLFQLALTDPKNSYTLEDTTTQGDRYFKTSRAITDSSGQAVALIVTRQTLSLADQQINNNIKNSIIILLVVLVLLMLLFLRHSRIIDYTMLYRKLKDVDRLKDDFISMASHELRTPVTVIRGYLELLSESKELNAADRDALNHVTGASEHLGSLIEDMLDVSRLEQDRLDFENKEFNPEELVGGTVETFQAIAKQKGLLLVFKSKQSATILADENRLRQVVVNLVGNAIKYTPASTATTKNEVNVKMYTEKDRLIIRVIDSGIGMTEDERANLFQKFYRIRNQETQAVAGTGLGLWITKQIVEKMGGTISVESIKGVGSHFIVSLPIVGNSA